MFGQFPRFDEFINHHARYESNRRAHHDPTQSVRVRQIDIGAFGRRTKPNDRGEEDDLGNEHRIVIFSSISDLTHDRDHRTGDTPGDEPIRLQRTFAQHHANILHEIVEA